MHKGLQMLWLWFPMFLKRCSDSGRKDPLFLFFADLSDYLYCCCGQMIYSHMDLGQ